MSDIVIAGRGHCCDPFSALKEEIDMAVTIAMNARSIAEEALTTAGVISGNAMKYQGTVGTGGTITSLPAASPLNIGNVYVALESGTVPVTYETGDMLISNGINWVVVPSGDDPVDWSQILNTPDTIAGYGITDAVDTASAQTVGGVKTFTSNPKGADPAPGATDTSLVTANWTSQTGDSAPNNLVHRTGNETINGNKTFISSILLPRSSNIDMIRESRTDLDVMTNDSTKYQSILGLVDMNGRRIVTLEAILRDNKTTALRAIVRNSDGTDKYVNLASGDVI